jgi:hypothetical protein
MCYLGSMTKLHTTIAGSPEAPKFVMPWSNDGQRG